MMFEDIHTHMERAKSIDPDTYPLLGLLADSSFITSRNPQTAIYYKVSEYIVRKAFEGESEISEDDLNRHVMTTRGWSDAFKVFEQLNLVHVKTEKFRRVLVLTDKTRKFAAQYRSGDKVSEIGVIKRLAHIYAGYVLLYLLKKIANLDASSLDTSMLPYSQRPRTLWVTLMFLWGKAFKKNSEFNEEELRVFVSKRRIPSSTRGRLLGALEAMSGQTTQGLIKEVSIDGDNLKFTFEDYAVREMERLRNRARERRR
jgi:hypothetical protein